MERWLLSIIIAIGIVAPVFPLLYGIALSLAESIISALNGPGERNDDEQIR